MSVGQNKQTVKENLDEPLSVIFRLKATELKSTLIKI